MLFSDDVQELVTAAGWYPGRDVSAQLKLPYDDYPEQALEFLREYSGLKIDCFVGRIGNILTSDRLTIEPETDEDLLTGDYHYRYFTGITGKKFYPLGYYQNDGYDVACDEVCNVYMLGENCYHWGSSLKEGIERIMHGQWMKALHLDEKNGNWLDYGNQIVAI